MEPPFWYYPVHQSLGAALLAQGKPAEAEAAFREALKRSPNNGWATAGLLRAAEARNDAEGAAAAQGDAGEELVRRRAAGSRPAVAPRRPG